MNKVGVFIVGIGLLLILAITFIFINSGGGSSSGSRTTSSGSSSAPISTKPGTTPDGSAADPSTGANSNPTGQASNSRLAGFFNRLFTDPLLYETLAAAIIWESILHHQRVAAKFRELSRKAVNLLTSVKLKNAALKDARRVLVGTGAKAGQNAAEKAVTRGLKSSATAAEKSAVAAAKAGQKLATQQAVALSSGPAAPFVEVAEQAFNIVSGAMDGFNLGGFQNISNTSMFRSMKSEIDYEFASAMRGSDFPVMYGPLDELDPDYFQSNLVIRVTNIYLEKIAQIQQEWANGTRAKLPTGSDANAYIDYFDAHIDMDACFDKALQKYCTDVGGNYMKHPHSSNMYCSFTQDKCNPSWPLADGATYFDWDSTNKVCAVQPSLMRSYCENVGLDVTYNRTTGICNLTDKYCRRYGADQGVRNGDCSFSQAEQIAQVIFGTAFVNSIVNVFDPHNYAACPPGSDDAIGIATATAVIATAATGGIYAPEAAIGAAAMVETLCETDTCGANEEKMGGLCYPKCRPGYSSKWGLAGSEVAGMCYENCTTGYLGTPVACVPVNTPCTDPGFTTKQGGICYSDKVRKLPGGAIATTIPATQKKCSDWNSSWRDDGTSCWEDLKCETHADSNWNWTNGGFIHTTCGGCGCIKKTAFQRYGCPEGYESSSLGLCQAVTRPLKSLKIRKSYSRAPTKTSYRVFPKQRTTPFPSTSEEDFKNSDIGNHIQQGINAVRNGDPTGFAKAVAGTMIVANPLVLEYGLTPMADLATEKIGLKSSS